ncbi:putative secretion ATPase, PEP-CTERM locus family protein [uncultured Desulfobacterium sp.]|uniref:Putative secretion ATPase, PEP-CTERM locus family protein n=1 Tax=uncultured Desulfobacterium sp. TaxID=201089 RepID=A0A445MUP3_9BACT|nr:putative secretion ATPase, PEP-CTERM locus family protein [uncultured Desulfobacterium sp.]
MYESFYGLKEKPFDLHPDPDYLFMSQGHDNAFTHLEYAIAENKGFVIITGEIGSGKTTLINYFLHKIPQDTVVGLINNTFAVQNNFIKMICQEFELDVKDKDKVGMLDLFYGFLIKKFSEKKRVVLIIDEAQNLTPEAMEEIRMISNLESEKHYLIQMILAGQPELKYKLHRKDLEQFAQRVTVHCHLGGMGLEETDSYIRHRLRMAGAQDCNIFENGAIEAVHTYSGGIPRLINILCDTALVYGYADEMKVVSRKVVEDVIQTREAGGIFSSTLTKEDALPSTSEGSIITKQMEERLISMERRISLMENIIDGMSRDINKITEKRTDRDDIVIELFRMLKDSIDSRLNTLMNFSRYKKIIENNSNKTQQDAPQDSRSFMMRLMRKKKGQ